MTNPDLPATGQEADAPFSPDHLARVEAGSACHAAALGYLAAGFAPTCCCDPAHYAVGVQHAKTCNSPGKAPMFAWKAYQTALPDAQTLASWWSAYPMGNVGIILGQASGVVRVDIDGEAGLACLHEWSAGELPPTWAFTSSADGFGLLYAWPKDLPCQSTTRPEAGVHQELRLMGNGAQTILPPSRHPGGGLYTWLPGQSPDDLPLAPAPGWLRGRLQATPRPPRPSPTEGAAPSIPPDQEGLTAMVMAIPNTPDVPADYDTWLQVGMALHSTGAPWAAELWDLWSQQSTKYDVGKQGKSWESFADTGGITLGTLFHLAREAGWQPPRLVVGTQPPPLPPDESHPSWPLPWRHLLLTTKQGTLMANVSNYSLILANHPFWQEPDHALWWDTVHRRAMMGQDPVDDDTIIMIAEWLGTVERISISNIAPLERCVLRQCHQAPRDVIQEWLTALPPWDGVERLPHWLIDHAGVVDTLYARAVSRLWPVSMVARAMEPGCQYRYVVMLEGAENVGKSRLVRLMGAPWYRELSGGFDGKEAHMLLQGAWLVELAEMASLRRTEEARLKSFITMTHDEYVPKYANLTVSVPRRAVFIGTHNPEGDGAILTGQTGNTRFLPLSVATVDLESVACIRDQLFAEALSLYATEPETWWQLSGEAEETAQQERQARSQESVYTEALAQWLLRQGVRETSWEEVAIHFLGAPRERWTRKMQMDVGLALRRLGWMPTRRKVHGRDYRFWQAPPETLLV